MRASWLLVLVGAVLVSSTAVDTTVQTEQPVQKHPDDDKNSICGPHCALCLTRDRCMLCFYTYDLDHRGKCVCKEGHFDVGIACVECADHCHKCRNPFQCEECAPTYERTREGKCECPKHTFEHGGRCHACSTCRANQYQVAACSHRADTQCANCDASCATCNGGAANQCTSCVAGHFFSGGSCPACTVCPSGSYASAACTATADTQCSACSTCSSSQYLISACTATSNTQCGACDLTCATCSGAGSSACLSCNAGRFFSGGSCAVCSSCGTNQYQTSACTTTSDTQCGVCTTCATNQYIATPCGATSDTVCAACDSSCLTCSGAGPSSCTSCPSGYSLIGGQCVDGCDPTCLTCSGPAPNQCTSCAGGKYLQNGQCLSCGICPSDFYVVSACTATQNTVCGPCYTGTPGACASCIGPNADQCTSCQPVDEFISSVYIIVEYWANNGVCTPCTTCAAGQWQQTACGAQNDAVCLPCSICDSHHFQQAACTSTSDTQCGACDSSCLTCDGAGPNNCVTCPGGGMSQGGQCSSSKSPDSSVSTIVSATVIPTVGLAAAGVVFCFFKRWKYNKNGSREPSEAGDVENGTPAVKLPPGGNSPVLGSNPVSYQKLEA